MEYLVKVRISFWEKLDQEDFEFWHLAIWTSSYHGDILLWEKLLPKAQPFSKSSTLSSQRFLQYLKKGSFKTSKKNYKHLNLIGYIHLDGSKNWTCFRVSTSNWVLKRWRVVQITFQPLLEPSLNSKGKLRDASFWGWHSPGKCSFHYLCRLWGWFVVPGLLCFAAFSFCFPGLSFVSLGLKSNPFLLGPSSTSLLRRSFGWSLLVSAPAWFDCFCCMFITFAFNIGLLFFGRWTCTILLQQVSSFCSYLSLYLLVLVFSLSSPSSSPFPRPRICAATCSCWVRDTLTCSGRTVRRWQVQDIILFYGGFVKLPVVPGQAGGGSFQKEKNYIAQKEFAYRMCARRPTSAMPKSFLCCERAFCRSMVVMFCALKWSVFDVLMSVAGSGHVMVTSFDAMWWLVLCHVTWCNAMSWWWAVLLQY